METRESASLVIYAENNISGYELPEETTTTAATTTTTPNN